MGAALLQACSVEDNSSTLYPKDNPNFSTITITSPTKSLSVDFGAEFVFTPTVKQVIEGKELQYIWTANKYDSKTEVYGDQFSCGEGSTLKFKFPEAGNFKLRLEVKNNDYSEFKSWDLAVRTYDKGFFVVGMDAAGMANIAFGRTLSATDSLEGKKFTFSTDLIAQINPKYTIKDVVYIGKSMIAYGKPEAYIHIFCKDKIYTADAYTLEIFDVKDFTAQFPGEYIKSVSMYDETNSLSSTLYTSKNRFLVFKRNVMGLGQADSYAGYFYDEAYTNLYSTSGQNGTNIEAGIVTASSKIYMTIPYYNNNKPANNTTGSNAGGIVEDNVKPNIYADYNIINVMRMNGDYWKGNKMSFFTIAQKKSDPNSVKIVEFKTDTKDGFTTLTETDYNTGGNMTYKKGVDIVSNARFDCAYYPSGSKLYLWEISATNSYKLPTTECIDLGAGKEITAVTLSYNMKQLYVAFYDNNSSNELKGGVYFYDTSKLKGGVVTPPTEKYENITTRPVQILFKSDKTDLLHSDN